MDKNPIIIERTFNVPASNVWQAITDPGKMKQWYFDIPGFKAEPGCEFQFLAGTEDQKWLHLCKVTEVIPLQKLTYTWRYDGHPGNSFVTFELIPDGAATKVKLTHKDLETFPPLPEFKKENFEEGWKSIICNSLKEFLTK
jgi:uncharacterized protein YndB with AHSA1/START domain